MKDNEQEEIGFSDEEKKLLNKYIEEYNDLFQKILILSDSDFLENIKKKVIITLKSKIKNYSQNTIKKVEDYLKEEIYLPDYKFASIIKKNILNRTKREKALHYFRGEIIPHCSEDKKDDYYIHVCGERFQFFRYKINNNNTHNLTNNNIYYGQGIYYDYILYCIKCDLIYRSSLIKFKCYSNDTEFYSKLLVNSSGEESSKSNKNNYDNNCYATWKKYHCNAIINDTMKCDKCKQSYLFLQENGLIYCPSCKIKKNPLDITWKCLICQNDFQTEAKIYNPLEYKSLKICVKDSIANNIKAKPEYMVCKCKIDINKTKFFHKSVCKGELFLGEINSQKVVVCGKCDTLGLYEGYIWTCPKCMKRFKTKKREGSICTKLGLTEVNEDKKESLNKQSRKLSHKNSGKKNNIISNDLNISESNTLSNDNNTLNYLNDMKKSINLNKANSYVKDISNGVDKKRKMNLKYKEKLGNSFIEDKSSNYETNNFSISGKMLPHIHKIKTNASLNTNFYNNMITKDKSESSTDSKFKSPRYIINNYKKKNNFHIKNNFQINPKDKHNESDLFSSTKNNTGFSQTQSNPRFDKVQSESKDKNSKIKSELSFHNDENNIYIPRKLSSYRKPYYSINNSFIKGLQKENNNINENDCRNSAYELQGRNNNFNLNKENKFKGKQNKSSNEVKDLKVNILENNEDINIGKDAADSKKKFKKKNGRKKYLYNQKEYTNDGENKSITTKSINFAEININDLVNDKNNYTNLKKGNIKTNNNSKLSKKIKLANNNNININININSSISSNDSEDNMNEINSNKRIYSNSIIMHNLTINDRNSLFKSVKISKNNNVKKSKTLVDKENLNNDLNKINTNININNINNNFHFYNSINNEKAYYNKSQNKSNDNKNDNNNYCQSFKKIENNKISGSSLENEQHKKSNKNKNNSAKGSLSIHNSNKKEKKDATKYLFNPKYRNFSDYKLVKQIGKGTFGQIFMVENNHHQCFALKKLMATNLKDIKTLEHEYQILLDIQSCGKKIDLVQIYGIETKQLDPTTFVMYVLMELASTDWEKEILSRHNKNKYYTENELMEIISSLITTFAQLQKENISHRDIKPQNILIFKDTKTYKLADFGEAKELLGDDRPTERQTLRGTELYMSPILFHALRSRKIIKYVKHNTYKSDLFSFGLCCLFAATLCFESLYDIRELRNNTAIKYIVQKYLENKYSNVVINIICNMLDVNEDSRNDFIEMEKEIKSYGY
mgnify:CR=1 FL=1